MRWPRPPVRAQSATIAASLRPARPAVACLGSFVAVTFPCWRTWGEGTLFAGEGRARLRDGTSLAPELLYKRRMKSRLGSRDSLAVLTESIFRHERGTKDSFGGDQHHRLEKPRSSYNKRNVLYPGYSHSIGFSGVSQTQCPTPPPKPHLPAPFPSPTARSKSPPLLSAPPPTGNAVDATTPTLNGKTDRAAEAPRPSSSSASRIISAPTRLPQTGSPPPRPWGTRAPTHRRRNG